MIKINFFFKFIFNTKKVYNGFKQLNLYIFPSRTVFVHLCNYEICPGILFLYFLSLVPSNDFDKTLLK